jgi:hypothetical protein
MEAAMAVCPEGRLMFANGKTVVRIKIYGHESPLLFRKRDKVAFRIDDQALIVESPKGPRASWRCRWGDIEQILAGEPEAENESLFQG